MEKEKNNLKFTVTFNSRRLVSIRFTDHCQVCLTTEVMQDKLNFNYQNEITSIK